MCGTNDGPTISLCSPRVSAGCYWGTEKYFAGVFSKKHPGAILATAVGFMGGTSPSATYKEVCTGRTGHVEVLQLAYDPSKVEYEDLVRFFYTFHVSSLIPW